MEILKTKSFKKKNIKSLHFETIEELINFNKKNNFFFLNRELFILINDGKEDKDDRIEYTLEEKKKIVINIKDKSFPFPRFENFVYSVIYSNIIILTKLTIYQNNLFQNRNQGFVYIINKDMLSEYKEIYKLEKLKKKIEQSNLTNRDDEKQIFDFVESSSESYINSIKNRLDSFKFNPINIIPKEIKIEENITFQYFDNFDNLLFDGPTSVNNFKSLNGISGETGIIVKFFFFNEKILILFRNNKAKVTYAQIGKIIVPENDKTFDVDYLIRVKENLSDKDGITLFDRVSLQKFYEDVYRKNEDNYFEYSIDDKIFLYVIKFENAKKIELLNNTDSNNFQNNNNEPNKEQNNNINNNENQNEYNNQENEINKEPLVNKLNIDNNLDQNNDQCFNDLSKPNPFYLGQENNNIDNNNINQNFNADFNQPTKIILNNIENLNINNNYANQTGNNNNNNNLTININLNPNSFGSNNNNNNNYNDFSQNQNQNNNNIIFNNMNNNNMNNNMNYNPNNNIYPMYNNNVNYQNQIIQPMYDFNKIKNYLNAIISFIKSDHDIKEKMKKKNCWNLKEKLTLINSQWIITFRSILNEKEIRNIYNSINNPNIMTSNNINNIEEKIFEILPENLKQYFNNIDQNWFKEQLNNNCLLNQMPLNNNGENLPLFYNFYFIGESFCNFLYSSFGLNIFNFTSKFEYMLINNKIYAFTPNNIIYIVTINENNFNRDQNQACLFDKIICYKYAEIKNEIIDIIQNNNFNYSKYLFFSGELMPNNFNIPIWNINQNSIKSNNIIERLKAYIYFDNYRKQLNKDINKSNVKDEIVIVKKNLLDKIRYDNIMNILNKYIQIYEKENNIEQKIDNILSNLDEVDIKLFKQELSQINFDNILI